VRKPRRDRQQVSAGAWASPSWSGGRRRPTRIHSPVGVGVELMGGVEEVADFSLAGCCERNSSVKGVAGSC
jgi:hypothetical protein